MTTLNSSNEPENQALSTMHAVTTLETARTELEAASFPLELGSAAQARREREATINQVEDYVLPRYRSLDAPLLVVVGGSTGAGKSTLVNALIGHPVTRAGAIRPTTRQPILLHHPSEEQWFSTQRVLPGLNRIKGRRAEPNERVIASEAGDTPDPQAIGSVVLLAEERVPQGVALLDAPDIDSVSDDNRALAGQLLAAADLWLFVTTANRYADAIPWRLLVDAAKRDITVGVVLDRVPPEAAEEIGAHLRSMLSAEGLSDSPLFVVEEARLNDQGMLPAESVAPIQKWLGDIAEDSTGRAGLARKTLNGAVRQLAERMTVIGDAEMDQVNAADRLAEDVHDAYRDAAVEIDSSTKDGTLLRGEVLARWQDFVGTGEFFRSLESTIGRLRDRIGSFFTGKPAPVQTVEDAIETGLHAVIVSAAARAAEVSEQRWKSEPAGRSLIGTEDLARVSPGFQDKVAEEVRNWQGDLLELIRTEGEGKRMTARLASFGVNGVAVALMIVVFASTAGLTGIEVGIAGGSAIVGQKLLEAIFGEDAVRRLAKIAREQLGERVQRLLDEESNRFIDRLDGVRTQDEVNRLIASGQELAALAHAAKEDHGQA
ncbi:energy-coupling factor transporter ATP-binding protein EcfA2 [Neomicrococcus aestuarii]|uniref:Energy-coupling factor transporter ATP-binding protein EcfA2 n=2 Tax=Neomicrococcus aestuarii TaxID=556325 RepID=A0A7W8TTS7_9MICC|nr:energy-coupling factor transporter ATP-binding protein EcfA2 [Neomicrococcus aestuarii]